MLIKFSFLHVLEYHLEFLVFLLFKIPVNPYLAVVALAGFALLFLAAITPNRQAAHDLLAHSLVVNRKALKSPEHRELLRAHVADNSPSSRAKRRPSARLWP